MASSTEDSEKAIKFFNTTRKVWLYLLCIFSSRGWLSSLEFVLRILFQLSLGFVIVGLLVSLPRVQSYSVITELSMYLLGAIILTITNFRVWWGQYRLVNFLKNVLHSGEQFFGKESLVRGIRQFRWYCVIIVSAASVHSANVIFIPFAKFFVLNDFNERNIFPFPYFLTCKHSDVILSDSNYLNDFCWDIENSFQYSVKHVFLSWVLFVMIVPYFVFLTFGLFVTFYVEANTSVIKAALDKLARTTHETVCDERRELKVRGHLCRIIEYYQQVYRIVNKIIPILNVITEFFLTVVSLLSLNILLPILTDPDLFSNPVYALKSTSILIIFFTGLSTFCYGGYVIKKMNSEIADTVYNLPWDSESISYRQLVYSFLLLLQRPCRVVALHAVVVDLRTSLLTLYRIYSLLNALLSAMR